MGAEISQFLYYNKIEEQDIKTLRKELDTGDLIYFISNGKKI